MQGQDQFNENEDQNLESLNKRNYTLSLTIQRTKYHPTRGIEDADKDEFLEGIIMNISLTNQYQRKILLQSEVLNLIFQEIYQMKECKHISKVMIKSDAEIDFNQLLTLISNIPSVKKISIEQTKLSKELLLITGMISNKFPNLEELYLNDNANDDYINKKYLNYQVVCKYDDNKQEEQEEIEEVVQNKLRNLTITSIEGVQLFELFPNLEVLEILFDEQIYKTKEFFQFDLEFIFKLKQLKDLHLRLDGKILREEVTSVCWILNQPNISTINLNFKSLSFGEELSLALEVRNMKNPEKLYLNCMNLFDLSESSEYLRKRFSIVVLGFLGISQKINNLLGYLNCEVEDLVKKEKDRINLLFSQLQEILAPFKKMKLSDKKFQPQLIWKSLKSVENANSLWNSEETKEELKKWCLSDIKFSNPSLQVVNLLSKDLVYLEFEKYHFNLFEIDQLTAMFPQLMTICGISLILNKSTEEFIPDRNICLRILIEDQSQLLEEIFKVKGHLISIINFYPKSPISFEQAKKIIEQIFNSNNRILCETGPLINYQQKPQLKEINNYRITVIQQLIHAKIFFSLIADYLTINPYMVFQENWL